MIDQLMGVITLKVPTYRQIADDKNLTANAAIIVVVSIAVASFFQHLVVIAPDLRSSSISLVAGIVGAIVEVIIGVIGWAVTAWILAYVAKSFFQGKTNTSEMLRVTGYVHVFNLVGILTILGAITPALLCIAGLIGFVAAILRLIGYVIGVREAAEFSTTNAIITAIIAAVIEFIIVVVIGGSILLVVLAAAGVAGGLRS